MDVELPIGGGFYKSDSLPIAAQECVNWFVNIPQGAAISDAQLFGVPGKVLLKSSGTTKQINRGIHVKGGIPYFVNGTTLYSMSRSVDTDGVETFTINTLGTIPGSGRVSMADNGTQLMVLVPGGNGYIYNELAGTPFSQITDTDFTANGDPQMVVFVDGYFLVTTDSKKFIVSSLNDGTSWDALDFGTAESDPDDIVSPVVFRNQVFIFGSETGEGFQNIGGADFPFVRTGLFIDKGVFARHSIINTNSSFMFIGGGVNESPAIWQYSSGLTKISTTAIDDVLNNLTDTELSEVFSWSYAQKGQYFIGFVLPSTVFVYNATNGLWHERKSYYTDGAGFTSTIRDRSNGMVNAYGRILVSDSVDGRIGYIDIGTYTEYGANIIRTFSPPTIENGQKSFILNRVNILMESGVGDLITTDPQVTMSLSQNNRQFNYNLSRSIGAIGEYGWQVVWRRLGRIKRYVTLKFTLSDPVKPVVIKVIADIIPGTE